MDRGQDDAWAGLEVLATRLAHGEDAAWQPFLCALEPLALPILQQQWRRLDRGERFEEAEDAARCVLLKVQQKLQRQQYKALRIHLAKRALDAPAAVAPDSSPIFAPKERGSFRGFLRAILVRATIDYQRTHPHYRRASRAKRSRSLAARSSVDAEPGRWISFISIHTGMNAARDPVTLTRMVQEMLAYLDEASRIATDSLRQAAAPRGATPRSAAVYSTIAEKLNLWRAPRDASSRAEPDTDAARHLVHHGALYRQAIELHVQGWDQVEIGAALGVTRRVAQKILERATDLLQNRFAVSCQHYRRA